MKTLTYLIAGVFLGALLSLQPTADAADKKKVFTPAEIAEAQRQTAIRQAAAAAAAKKKRAAAAAAAGVPAAPAGPGGQAVQVQVQILNLTDEPVNAVFVQADGSTQNFGQVQPSGPQRNPTPLQTGSGFTWVFTNAAGQVLTRFTATNAPQQTVQILPPRNAAAQAQQIPGAPPQVQAPAGNQPPAGLVKLTVQSNWPGIVNASRADKDGTIRNFEISPKGTTLVSQAGARWIFNGGGQTILEYTTNTSTNQAITLPSPAEFQAAMQKNAVRDNANQEANAAKQGRQNEFLARLNDARLQAGAPPLKWSQALADKAAQTFNPLGAGYSMAVVYSENGQGPQSPREVLDYWFTENWGKGQLLLDEKVTAVGYWESGRRFGLEYAPR